MYTSDSKENTFLKTQIITYMGNKRKLLPDIERIICDIKDELGYDDLKCADAFSGSGIVSRLLKLHSKTLYVNDIAGYSKTLNTCFLSTLNSRQVEELGEIIRMANEFAHLESYHSPSITPWISKHWAPSCDSVQKSDRVYFTRKNGVLLDRYMHFIFNGNFSDEYRPFLHAMVLVEASIHNNTSGQFSAFYKDKNGIGKFGGEREIDLHRITKDIYLSVPNLSNNPCDVHIYQSDAIEWVKTIPMVDIMYVDPPYNKHPYSIYYFMLDIINDWNLQQDIPNTNRGQPKDWKKSAYNSFSNAETAFSEFIQSVKTKFLIVSYNNKGIIPISNLERILNLRGKVYIYPVNHKTYNRMKGIANYKRTTHMSEVKEFIWLVDLR